MLFRFKKPALIVLANLTSIKYTFANAKLCRESAEYIQSIIRHAKSANIDNVFN